jgi:hypothetical protein
VLPHLIIFLLISHKNDQEICEYELDGDLTMYANCRHNTSMHISFYYLDVYIRHPGH